MTYAKPGTEGSPVAFKAKYDNYIGGDWVAPVDGQYFDNISPVDGQVFCQIARSNDKDINLALDAAHNARAAWGSTSVAERANIRCRARQHLAENRRSHRRQPRGAGCGGDLG